MSELFGEFGIDWKLLLAQAINFAILVFLLKKFLYRPILNVLAARREKIEKGLRSAKEAEEKLQKIGRAEEAILADAHKKELEIVNNAEMRSLAKEKEIMKTAQAKAEEIIKEGKKRTEEDKIKLLDSIYGESAELIKNALAKVFEKSPEQFEDALIEKSLQELKSLKS